MHHLGLRPLYLRDLGQLWQEVGDFPDEAQLWWVPKGVHNSAGNLCLHICGSLRHYLGAVLNKDGYVRDREREFAAKGLSKAELLAEVDHTVTAVDNALLALNADRMEQPWDSPVPPGIATVGQLVLHLHGHLNLHLGQINYLRRMPRG